MMEITWITQGGFIFDNSGHRLVVDPYISDVAEKTLGLTRMMEPPISIEKLMPDVVFCSHNHIDHLDPISIPLIAKQYPLCRFIGPKSVTDDLLAMGIGAGRIITLSIGEKVEVEGFVLIGTPAYHSDTDAIGLVIQVCQKSIYISGDTLYNPNLAMAVAEYSSKKIDLAFICINGRLGNMDLAEAVEVVKQIQPDVAVPMHYGLFAENTVAPEPFVRKCDAAGIKAFLFKAGKAVSVTKIF
jgi:L-ascorbate metabolism protein UlaG (beta-lactamase superfamily)